MLITPKTFEEVPDEVTCPYELQYVWEYFRELDSRRPVGGMGGFTPISHTEITHWSEGMGIGITPFERSCIIAIDNAYRIHLSEELKNE
jgi:hypothetical protein